MRYSRLKKKYLFLDISSTTIDTLVTSLYQCVETRSIEVFWLLSQSLPFQPRRSWENFSTQLWAALRDKHFPPQTENISFLISFALSPFAHKKVAHQNAALRWYTRQSRPPFWLLKPASEHAHARLPPRLSWSCTVLLPSDTHRKPITSITAVLLPFVTYLLTPSYFHMLRLEFDTVEFGGWWICRRSQLLLQKSSSSIIWGLYNRPKWPQYLGTWADT
jgi:hypothetical protein